MLDLDSPLAPHAQLRTLRQELDLYQPGLPWARSRRAVIAANNPNPNPNPNPNRNRNPNQAMFVGDPNASLTGGKAIAVPGELQRLRMEIQGDTGLRMEMQGDVGER